MNTQTIDGAHSRPKLSLLFGGRTQPKMCEQAARAVLGADELRQLVASMID